MADEWRISWYGLEVFKRLDDGVLSSTGTDTQNVEYQADPPDLRSTGTDIQNVEYQADPPNIRATGVDIQNVEYQLSLPFMQSATTVVQAIQRAPEIYMATEIYPDLIGLGYSVILRPMFSTKVSEHTSGDETRTSYWQNPKWEILLTYEYLPNRSPNPSTDYKELLGFFLARRGKYEDFLIKVSDNYIVVDGLLGEGDGLTVEYELTRQLGSHFEPIGQADPANTVIKVRLVEPRVIPVTPGPYTVTANHFPLTDFGADSGGPLVKVAGVPAAGQYSVNEATGVYTFNAAQQGDAVDLDYQYEAVEGIGDDYTILMPRTIVFDTAPPVGAVVTGDFEYYFIVRFMNDDNEFDLFMDMLYESNEVALLSQV